MIGSTNASNNTGRPVPIVLGVTGHRDLRAQDLDALRAKVRGVIESLKLQYPCTPLVLLSPLAAGADRLVAEASLACGVGLIVPLPWPEGVYDQRVHRTGNRQEFDDLLDRAEQTIFLPLAEGVSAGDIQQTNQAREVQYSGTGAYIARHSQILIALWDGEDRPDSGTAQVVRWQQTGVSAPFAAPIGRLDELENGPVYHVTTPRANHQTSVTTVTCVEIYPKPFPDDAVAKRTFHQIWHRIDTFNADVSRSSTKLRDQISKSRDWILPDQQWNQLGSPLRSLFESFVQADAAAVVFRDKTLQTLKGLFIAMLTALLCYEVYTHLFVETWPLLLTYIVLLIGVLQWHRWSTRRELQLKYLDYRALAESLRVQCFWRLAGLSDSVVDHYLRNLRSELDWIRQALRASNLVCGGHQPPTPATTTSLIVVDRRWVEDQLKFFRKSAPAEESKHQWWLRGSRWLFATAAAMAVIQLIVHLSTNRLNHMLAVLVFVAIACSALCHEYAEMHAYSVQAKRYDWMRSFFQTGHEQLQALIEQQHLGDAQEVIRELGQEALQENNEWLLQRRHRPIRPPQV